MLTFVSDGFVLQPRPKLQTRTSSPRDVSPSGGLVIPGKGNDMDQGSGSTTRPRYNAAARRNALGVNHPGWKRLSGDPNQRSRNESMDALGSVVYAARLSDGSIKIGHTGRLSHRLHKLASYRQCDVELLACVPGSRDDEAALHARLTPHIAAGREYYHDCPEVLTVVNELRQTIGLASTR